MEVYQNDSLIYATCRTILPQQDFPGCPKYGTICLRQPGDYTEVVFKELVPNVKCKAVKRTFSVDKEAKEAKLRELDAILQEYGACFNGHNGKYAAHVVSISSEKFTTIHEEEVEVLAHVKIGYIKT